MEIKELFYESTTTLTLNKIRTGLAMLGVIIGIGSVIALMTLGQSSQSSITSQIQSLGTNLLTVMPGFTQSGGVRGAAGGASSLTNEDAKAILTSSQITTVSKVSPELTRNSQVVTSKNNINTSIYGVEPDFLTVRNASVQTRNFITERNLTSMSRVAVLGTEVVTNLFPENPSPIGESIRINGIGFTVIGVMTTKGGSGFNNQDDRVYIPLTTAQKVVFGQDYINNIAITAKSEDNMTLAKEEITQLLLTRHKISDPNSADFRILSQEDLLGTVSQVTGTFTALLSGIAAISLVVGGIGIMNIMLVTVTERTREIGLRQALGAKKKIIIAQFLLESTLITFIGGIIGTALGIIVSYILTKVLNMPFQLSFNSIGLAFGVSCAIGIIFGWYPAQKAAKLQPIEALRYE